MLTDNSSAQTSPWGSDRIDRRKRPRVDVLCGGSGELILAELDGCTGGLIIDVGAGGMSVQVAGPVPPSSELKVAFNLGQAASTIQAKARPVWYGGNGRLGICFVEFADEAYNQLTQWLSSRSGIPQPDPRIVPQEPAAEPGIAAAYDRQTEKECLASKLARAYGALPSYQSAAARCSGSDVQTTSAVGNISEDRLETHLETGSLTQHKSSPETPRQELERQVLQEEPIGEVCQQQAGESVLRGAKVEQQNRPGPHSYEVSSSELERSTAEYKSLPRVLRHFSGSAVVAKTQESTPPAVISGVTTPEKGGFAREASSEGVTLGQIVAQVHQRTHADGAALALAEPSGAVICKASFGRAPKIGEPVNRGSGLSGECIRTGRVIACDDCSVDVRVPLAVSRDLGLQSIVVVPIFANGKTVGVLEVTSCAKAAFTSDHVAALQRLAREASPISTSPVSLPRPSLARFGALHDVAIPGAAITDRSRTPLNGDQEGAIGCASTADAEWAGLSSDSAPVIDRQESPEDLISTLRAASFREAGQKPRGPQPTSFLNDKYAKVAATANSIIANPADFSRKSLARAGRMPWLCGLVLIAGAILVGASVGWVLLVLETPTDFTVRFMPPPVPRGRVQPIRAVPKPTKSHSGDAGKHRDRRVELTEQVAAKQLLSSVDPEYPQEATLRQISGAVSLTLLIDRSGSVEAIQDVSGNHTLAAAAERAVRQWQFRRYLLHGQAVETLARVGFLFTLPDSHL